MSPRFTTELARPYLCRTRRTSDRPGTSTRPLPMLYLTVFSSALLAATIVPFASEIALTGALAAGGAVHWLVLVATLGNTLGAVVNWAVGRFIERFRDRRWFPANREQLERAQAWFKRYGVWSLLFAWLPVVGEPLTVVAGAMRVHIAPFLILVAIGKGLRYVVLALAVEGVVTP